MRPEDFVIGVRPNRGSEELAALRNRLPDQELRAVVWRFWFGATVRAVFLADGLPMRTRGKDVLARLLSTNAVTGCGRRSSGSA
jgi:hypothetical protein